MSARLADYDYRLPEGLIASRPLPQRDQARMMVLRRQDESIEHRAFADFPEFVGGDDLVVLNDTRVLAARRYSDDGAVELLLLEKLGPKRWRCLVKPGRKMRVGKSVKIDKVDAQVEEVSENGERIIALADDVDLLAQGAMPLPPYLRRASDAADAERYQTVFAREPGAVAAPTAGLHFTEELLARVRHVFVTLHVGPGTFRPVHSEMVAEHKMHSERYSISSEAADRINRAPRVIAIGTTVVRTLESAASKTPPDHSAESNESQIPSGEGETDIFIYPPFQFRVVDALLTNFHLPRSTLLMLVSAFAGREFVLRAYEEAIEHRYRFFSYGDCMLIL